MSKKHPGSPEMNHYHPDSPPIEHVKQENEPPHHDWHELEKLLTTQNAAYQRQLAASKPKRKATRKSPKKQPLL